MDSPCSEQQKTIQLSLCCHRVRNNLLKCKAEFAEHERRAYKHSHSKWLCDMTEYVLV